MRGDGVEIAGAGEAVILGAQIVHHEADGDGADAHLERRAPGARDARHFQRPRHIVVGVAAHRRLADAVEDAGAKIIIRFLINTKLRRRDDRAGRDAGDGAAEAQRAADLERGRPAGGDGLNVDRSRARAERRRRHRLIEIGAEQQLRPGRDRGAGRAGHGHGATREGRGLAAAPQPDIGVPLQPFGLRGVREHLTPEPLQIGMRLERKPGIGLGDDAQIAVRHRGIGTGQARCHVVADPGADLAERRQGERHQRAISDQRLSKRRSTARAGPR